MLVKVSLSELLESEGKEGVKNILLTFSSISHDVEDFLHTKAIHYETSGISRTYLVFSDESDEVFLAGYYSIANKALNINKQNYQRLSKSQRKKLMWSGYKNDRGGFVASSVLLGQLGKNYVLPESKAIQGVIILGLALETVREIYKLMGGKILWLECEDKDCLKKFYEKNGFGILEGYQSKNGLLVYIKKLSHI